MHLTRPNHLLVTPSVRVRSLLIGTLEAEVEFVRRLLDLYFVFQINRIDLVGQIRMEFLTD